MRSFLPAALAACTLLLAGCPDENLGSSCGSDLDCPPNFICDRGICVCKSDASCEAGERCNVLGFCQRTVGCESSLQCPPGEICDVTTKTCIEQDKCTTDIQCPLGQICDPVRLQCVDGCNEVGDCTLGAVCECPDAGSSCLKKQCKVGPCGDDSYCRYGEKCVEEEPGQPKRCLKDERGPYCEPCEISPGRNYCGESPRNYCLVDTSKPYRAYFCGVECQDDPQCPWGFECSDVLILTQDICGGRDAQPCPMQREQTCETDEDCERRGGHCSASTGLCECATDLDCPGGTCNPESKRCQSICVGGEGQFGGFCTCLDDPDCPSEVCDPFTNACSISGRPCSPDETNPCPPISCKQVRDPVSGAQAGYCFIGRNCAPVQGVSCDVVRAQ